MFPTYGEVLVFSYCVCIALYLFVRVEEYDKYLSMLEGKAVGTDLNWDSSPLRLFSTDRSSRNEDVLVRRAKIVGSCLDTTPFTPRSALTRN